MRKTHFEICFSAVSLLLFVSSALALPIQGSSSGIFTNPGGPDPMVTTGAGTSYFTWGVGVPSGSPPSSMGFSGETIDTDFNTPFSFGTLTYFNGTIVSDTGADSVDLEVYLSLISPAGINEDFAYNLSLINTPNTTDPGASADYVYFPTAFPSSSFSVGGVDYTLAFLGFGTITSGGFSVVNEFHVLEGQSSSAQLVGMITEYTANPVPEPGTMILLGSGLVGMAGYARKRRNT